MAAKTANAHEFISQTPDGYNTYVGEKGHRLESEFMIQQALERLTKGRTTFAIAHRLSTLKHADRLVVIDGHRVAEVGSHEELIAKRGIYYRLVKSTVSNAGRRKFITRRKV